MKNIINSLFLVISAFPISLCVSRELITICVFSSGSYSSTEGIPDVVQRISEFITRRDGGAPSYPENIYISPGSQWSITVISSISHSLLMLCINHHLQVNIICSCVH